MSAASYCIISIRYRVSLTNKTAKRIVRQFRRQYYALLFVLYMHT